MTRIIITRLSVVLFLYGLHADIHWIRLCSKPVPVLVLLWMVYPQKEKWLLGALGFSLLGDVVLELPKHLPFALGLGSFLIAHLLYIRRFLITPVQKMRWPIVPITMYCGTLFSYMQPNLGSLLIPVLLYVLVIATMLWSACGYSYTHKNTVPLIGAILFVISDSLIAINKFITSFPQARYAIIITYWLAQYLIVLPLLSHQKNESKTA